MKLSAAVLAGGRSTRMGADKAFLGWQGRRLIDHQLATLHALAPIEVFVSGRPDVAYDVPGIRVVHDAVANQGPLGGIAAVLAATIATHVAVLAVDMPNVTAAFLRSLLNRCRDGLGAVPCFGGRWEPLAAVYPRELFADAQARLTNGNLALQSLVADAVTAGRLVAVEVAEAQQPLLRNLNTPADC